VRRYVEELPAGVDIAIELVPPATIRTLAPAPLREVADDLGHGARALRTHLEPLDELFVSRIVAAFAMSHLMQRGDALRRRAQRRVDDDKLLHTSRIGRSIDERHEPAHRMADESEVAQIELFDHCRDIGHVALVAVIRRLGARAVAMAALVQRAHVIVGGEASRDEIEPVRVHRAAVQAQHGRAAFAAIVEVVEPEPVDFDEAASVLSGLWTFAGRMAL
jgi:hypothetical protein